MIDENVLELNRIKQVAKENGGVYRYEPLLEPEKYTVREAYDILHERTKFYGMKKGYSEDQANRVATLYAVKNAWIEFNIMNGLIKDEVQ